MATKKTEMRPNFETNAAKIHQFMCTTMQVGSFKTAFTKSDALSSGKTIDKEQQKLFYII
jgi:hypothetical protein